MSGVGYVVIGTGVVIVADVLNKQEFRYQTVIGGAITAMGVAALGNLDDGLSNKFGALLLVSVLLWKGVDLAKNLGVMNTGHVTKGSNVWTSRK